MDDLSSYSHIRVLKATMARSPCRKIPKESMKAPFSHPRLSGPGVRVEGEDVLDEETAGTSATSLSWEGISGQDRTTGQITQTTPPPPPLEAAGPQMKPTPPRFSPSVGQLIDVFGERWRHPLRPGHRVILLQPSVRLQIAVPNTCAHGRPEPRTTNRVCQRIKTDDGLVVAHLIVRQRRPQSSLPGKKGTEGAQGMACYG